MKKGLKIGAAVVGGLLLIIMFKGCFEASDAAIEGAKEAVAEHKTVEPEPTQNWQYAEEVDKMTSKTVYHGRTTAEELLDFNFPYNGGSTATLYLRNKDGVNEIILSVSKGQFNNGIDGGTVRLRFDNAEPETYHFSMPNDGSSENIFISQANKIISKLKKSTQVIIEAEFFDNGLKQMTFKTSGLDWKW